MMLQMKKRSLFIFLVLLGIGSNVLGQVGYTNIGDPLTTKERKEQIAKYFNGEYKGMFTKDKPLLPTYIREKEFINSTYNKLTPLTFAIRLSLNKDLKDLSYRLVKLLFKPFGDPIRLFIDINQKDDNALSPLMTAVMVQNQHIVKFLLADPDIEIDAFNRYTGQTALDYANQLREGPVKEEIIDLLRSDNALTYDQLPKATKRRPATIEEEGEGKEETPRRRLTREDQHEKIQEIFQEYFLNPSITKSIQMPRYFLNPENINHLYILKEPNGKEIENTPLIWAIKFDISIDPLLENTNILVNKKGDKGLTPLMHAVKKDDIETVKKLLAAGADLTLKNSKGNTAMIYTKTPEMRQILIETRNAGRPTPIQALEKPEQERFKAILQRTLTAREFPDINVLEKFFNPQNLNREYILKQGKKTPLMIAIELGDPYIVDEMLKAGADINVKNEYSPLDHAMQKGNDAIIRLLEEEEFKRRSAQVRPQAPQPTSRPAPVQPTKPTVRPIQPQPAAKPAQPTPRPSRVQPQPQSSGEVINLLQQLHNRLNELRAILAE